MQDEWEAKLGMKEARSEARAGGRRMLILTLASLAILNIAVYALRMLHIGL